MLSSVEYEGLITTKQDDFRQRCEREIANSRAGLQQHLSNLERMKVDISNIVAKACGFETAEATKLPQQQ